MADKQGKFRQEIQQVRACSLRVVEWQAHQSFGCFHMIGTWLSGASANIHVDRDSRLRTLNPSQHGHDMATFIFHTSQNRCGLGQHGHFDT